MPKGAGVYCLLLTAYFSLFITHCSKLIYCLFLILYKSERSTLEEMKILIIGKYPPIQGGVSAENYWFAQALVEIGHEVTVVTNAEEVEAEYAINIPSYEKKYLNGFRKENAVEVLSSQKDERMVYIPQDNPTVSKLVNLGLQSCHDKMPDIIIASYLEPYGVVALLLSKILNVPYVIRHAGSDIGRLMKFDQLFDIYVNIFQGARFIITTSQHYTRFTKLGIDKRKFVTAPSFRLPGDVFYPTENRLSGNESFKLHSIGKPGNAKGTKELLNAMGFLKQSNPNFSLITHWGGRHLHSHQKLTNELGISVCEKGYVPHWQIPQSIRSAHLGIFLENRFGIKFHTPGIPLEYWACGRPLIITKEISEKSHIRALVKEGRNAFIVKSCPVEPKEVADKILEAKDSILHGRCEKASIDASIASLRKKQDLKKFLSTITQ